MTLFGADNLNESLNRALRMFREREFCAAAAVKVDETRVLSYEKDGADWHFVVHVTHRNGDVQSTNLLRSNLKNRIDASRKLRDLWHACDAEHTGLIKSLDEATAAVDRFVDSMRER